MFYQYLQTNPPFYLAWVGITILSICFHEMCHAWMAAKEGDYTAWRQGYLTLNPFKVMGTSSLIALALLGIAWGAVPVNRGNFRRHASECLVAFAGPGANLFLALFFSLLVAMLGGELTLSYSGADSLLRMICTCGAMTNFFLFIFNVLPIPMLDGWDVFSFFIEPMRRLPPANRGRIGLVVIIVVFATGVGSHLWTAAAWAARFTVELFDRFV